MTSTVGRASLSSALVRRGRIALGCWVFAGLAAIIAFDIAPDRGASIGSAFLLVTTALALWTLLGGVDGGLPKWRRTSFDQVFTPRRSISVQLDEVEEIRRAVIFSLHSAPDVRSRLVPLVRRIVDALLIGKYGWGLDAPEEWVHDRVRPVVWDTLRRGPDARDRDAHGMHQEQMSRLVNALEELSNR
jgi:hypothetical protein